MNNHDLDWKVEKLKCLCGDGSFSLGHGAYFGKKLVYMLIENVAEGKCGKIGFEDLTTTNGFVIAVTPTNYRRKTFQN